VAERKPAPFAPGQTAGMFSPDGRYIVSNSSGQHEVSVRPYPGPGGPWQVSREGGVEPLWAHSGREIFFRSGDAMIVAKVETTPTFHVVKSELLFRGRFLRGGRANYAVSPDDQRLLMVQEPELPAVTVNVVLGWLEEIRVKASQVTP
jgi:serine/threonine-protein kinase